MVPRILNIPKDKTFFLFGPRQTGKTSLVRSVFEEPARIMVFDLLKTDEYMRLSAHPQLFRHEVEARDKLVSHVFVDEVQKIPALLDEIHFLLEGKNPPNFILTGSSARKLKRSAANLLGGRAWNLHLFPLTYRELGASFDLVKVLTRGTLPKIWLSDEINAQQLLRSYVETYLKEEIESEALVRFTGTFIRFIFQAGHESGNILNFSTIARDVGTSSKTVKEYFQILEDTLLGRFLFAYAKSSRKRLATHPKFYLFDCGVQRALSKQLNLEIVPGSSFFGNAFEHFVLNECFRLNNYLQKDFEFTYFRTEHGAEVDLIIETPDKRCVAVEIKGSVRPSIADVKSGLLSFKSVRSDAQLICVSNQDRPWEIDGIRFLPWRTFLEEFF